VGYRVRQLWRCVSPAPETVEEASKPLRSPSNSIDSNRTSAFARPRPTLQRDGCGCVPVPVRRTGDARRDGTRSRAAHTGCGSTPICGTRCTRRKIPSPRPAAAGARVRRWRRPEARPLAELSDSPPADVSDFGPALTGRDPARAIVLLKQRHPEWGSERIREVLLRGEGYSASGGRDRARAQGKTATTLRTSRLHRMLGRRSTVSAPALMRLWQNDLFTFLPKRGTRPAHRSETSCMLAALRIHTCRGSYVRGGGGFIQSTRLIRGGKAQEVSNSCMLGRVATAAPQACLAPRLLGHSSRTDL
jgi:hypothetical protein